MSEASEVVYGKLHPKRDKMMRLIILNDLRRKLMYVKLDDLDLNFLQPLRNEVQDALDNLKEWVPYNADGTRP